MKLSRLYASDKRFKELQFSTGLNVVVASIEQPENRKTDTHNLGKTTIAWLIDFCLLKNSNPSFFLSRHPDLFGTFEFFLELLSNHGEYITIRRGANQPSKISLKRHTNGEQDFRQLKAKEWDHRDLPIGKAKEILDGFFSLSVLGRWKFRDAVGYSLRTQEDYSHIYKLDKFRGSHSSWKPFVAHILGMSGSIVEKKYRLDEELKGLEETRKRLRAELSGVEGSPDLLESLILSKSDDIAELEEIVDSCNFTIPDSKTTKKLVRETELQIAELNTERYNVEMSLERIERSLDEQFYFDYRKIEEIFGEAQVAFPEQIKKNYQDLIEFNQAISAERQVYLRDEMSEQKVALAKINDMLEELNHSRARALASLKELETFKKYKKLNKKLVEMKAELEGLRQQRTGFQKLRQVEDTVNSTRSEIQNAVEKLQFSIDNPEPQSKEIRRYFRDIIRRTLNQDAVIFTDINSNGNLDFRAEILDEKGNTTSRDKGSTYKKLLCIAFDLALLRAYLDKSYVRFLYHDGVFETLDDRKKFNLIEILREYSALGIQLLVTTIESDLPITDEGERFEFSAEEVCCQLHDRGDEGRLFEMPEF